MTNASKTMENGRLKKGDKVIVNRTGKRGTVLDIVPATRMVQVQLEGSEWKEWHYAFDLRPETFLDFITRPTGFGKTPWVAAILIHLFSVAGAVSLSTIAWYWAPAGLIPAAVLWLGTYFNYTGKWK